MDFSYRIRRQQIKRALKKNRILISNLFKFCLKLIQNKVSRVSNKIKPKVSLKKNPFLLFHPNFSNLNIFTTYLSFKIALFIYFLNVVPIIYFFYSNFIALTRT